MSLMTDNRALTFLRIIRERTLPHLSSQKRRNPAPEVDAPEPKARKMRFSEASHPE